MYSELRQFVIKQMKKEGWFPACFTERGEWFASHLIKDRKIVSIDRVVARFAAIFSLTEDGTRVDFNNKAGNGHGDQGLLF